VAEVLFSIVIPIRRDAQALGRLLGRLPPHPRLQLIVSAIEEDEAAVATAGEFIRRLKREGGIRHLEGQLVTSARRWNDEGWWTRSSRNLTLLALYYVGTDPERLARWYDHRRA
jgi:hypothetical protein